MIQASPDATIETYPFVPVLEMEDFNNLNNPEAFYIYAFAGLDFETGEITNMEAYLKTERDLIAYGGNMETWF